MLSENGEGGNMLGALVGCRVSQKNVLTIIFSPQERLSWQLCAPCWPATTHFSLHHANCGDCAIMILSVTRGVPIGVSHSGGRGRLQPHILPDLLLY